MELSSLLAPELSPFFKISLALILGMILGIERVLAGRTAGPRTYGLVAIGSCLATIISVMALKVYVDAGITSMDPFHLIASIITGVGFIGAGLIVFHGSRLSGLTTAAGIWVAAIIGIAVGFEFYLIAIFTTFLTLFVFSIMWRVEQYITEHFEEHLPKEKQEND
jgi:putative Mg2+ transporter-C (MgtC) family protein